LLPRSQMGFGEEASPSFRGNSEAKPNAIGAEPLWNCTAGAVGNGCFPSGMNTPKFLPKYQI